MEIVLGILIRNLVIMNTESTQKALAIIVIIQRLYFI